MSRDIIRRCILRPYRKGMGPIFTLSVWDTHRRDWRGQSILGYLFRQHESGKAETLFQGEDFAGSPLHADDSDNTIGSLLSFLTLRPGDTDREYFDHYTEAQHEFCASHAEALQCECLARFGE